MAWRSVEESINSDFVNFGVADFVDGVPQVLLDEEHQQENQPRTVNAEHDHDPTASKDLAPSYLHQENLDVLADHPNLEEADEEIGRISCDDTLITHWTDGFIPPAITVFDFTSIETQLLEYYVYSLAPKCSLSIDLNPYLDVLLPVACEFAPLRHTLLAASACQLYHISGENSFQVQSLRHRSKAIRGLNEHLARQKMDWQSLATMVMFCFRDITDGCEPSWITHLNMGLRMLRELKCGTRTDADLRSFCEIYFVAHEVMGRTAWENEDAKADVYEWERDEGYQEVCASYMRL